MDPDLPKAAAWSIVAGAAIALHVLLSAVVAGPQLYGLLAVLGFGLLLPPIALLHARFALIRPQAAVLATLAGSATALAGVAALALNDLEPAALFFLGTWWWVTGKFVADSGVLPRAFGVATAAAAPLVYAALIANLFGLRYSWSAPRLALAAWLFVLASLLYREIGARRNAG